MIGGNKLAAFRCEARLIRRRLCGAQRRHRSQVRILSAVPCRSKRHIACSDFFQKSERAHFAAPPFQTEPAALGFDLVNDDRGRVCKSNPSRKLCIACDDIFMRCIKMSSCAHAAATPSKIATTLLGCNFVIWGADFLHIKITPIAFSSCPEDGGM